MRDFSAQFGELEINVANSYQEPGLPEVMILSNIVKNGKPIGLSDAGQDWHTDMSYSRTVAFANVLYGIKIPDRDGKPLGPTDFCNMHAAYEELPADLKALLEGMSVLHDFNKFWEMMRRERGSARPALTEAQRKAKPPVSHKIFLTHPLTGRKVLYANPGYAMRIKQVVAAHRLESRIDHTPFALADFVHRGLHVVVDAPTRHTPERRKGAGVRIKQHLVALGRIGYKPEGPARA